ncbi:Crp/Fnr family transcriptional regulator [Sulfuricurvum sp.]|uniref:Crp/Fnr family transcriptional regulator n=1 Tax=Sulfuricurvum sp. TaxID=2025608 RepID=UPI0019A7A7BD|nr:Crp/Fnr family transcriptional regulator [Sulfuricurvum sp.]MBD3799173.1 Crp/Fnr family transcriptional regulator [Campylobacterota bacterium]MBD3806281.1 Crp/Fnr family transcriptional regulator [Sulfuricurvum sp.]
MAHETIFEHQLITDTSPALSLSNLLTYKKSILFKVGETPFTSEDTLRYFYFIMYGKIKISQLNLDMLKEQTIYLLTRGDMFDVITLLDGNAHEYTSTVLEDSEVIQVPIRHIRDLIETNPAFNRYFFPYLGKQMRRMEDLAVDLSLYDVYHRLLRLFARNIDKEDKNSLALINDLSHEELAALVGSVRKVVNRNLQQLKHEGVIDIARKQIILTDLEKILDQLD